jgi:hypothetical protein
MDNAPCFTHTLLEYLLWMLLSQLQNLGHYWYPIATARTQTDITIRGWLFILFGILYERQCLPYIGWYWMVGSPEALIGPDLRSRQTIDRMNWLKLPAYGWSRVIIVKYNWFAFNIIYHRKDICLENLRLSSEYYSLDFTSCGYFVWVLLTNLTVCFHLFIVTIMYYPYSTYWQ